MRLTGPPSDPTADPALALHEVALTLGTRRRPTPVLAPTSLALGRGVSLAVVGRSGAGKSTLADIVLGLRAPSTGTVRVDGAAWVDPAHRPPRARRHLVQGVPQDAAAALVPGWSLRRSIALPLLRMPTIAPSDREDVGARVTAAAAAAGLDPDLLDRRPHEVSGGQAQRAAIARALVVDPVVLVADEPTSALDPATARHVADTLLQAAHLRGSALVLLTHDPALAERCDRTLVVTAPPAVSPHPTPRRRNPR